MNRFFILLKKSINE